MVFVKVRDAEHLEEALKRFKRECEKNGILKEIKRRETYTPPSVRRKLKPMSGRVVNKMGLEEDNQNFLLMYSISVNVSGQIASVIAGGLILTLLGA